MCLAQAACPLVDVVENYRNFVIWYLQYVGYIFLVSNMEYYFCLKMNVGNHVKSFHWQIWANFPTEGFWTAEQYLMINHNYFSLSLRNSSLIL